MADKIRKTKTGGRVKGVPNKANAKKERRLSMDGLMPNEFFLSLLRAPEPVRTKDESPKMFVDRHTEWQENRKWGAEKAAPYCHPKLATIVHQGDEDKPIQHRFVVRLVDAPSVLVLKKGK